MPKVVATSYKPVKFLRKLFKNLNVPYFAKTAKHYPESARTFVINFGATSPLVTTDTCTVNCSTCIESALDKRETMVRLDNAGVPTLIHTTIPAVAKEWLEQGIPVVGRKLVTSHSGKGIVIMEEPEEIVSCKLYTQLIKNGREFRVHAALGDDLKDLVLIQQKKRENGFTGNDIIKTRANGWVFCINSQFLETYSEVKEQLVKVARDAIDAVDLEYGAVDIIVKNGKLYVVEINTAPALKAESVQNYYKELFTRIVASIRAGDI